MRSSTRPSLPLAFAFVAALSQVSLVNAQVSSTVTCLSNTTFLYNSRQQTPCLVGAYLGSVCNGGQFTVSPLDPGEYYTGARDPDDCTCSTVTYSMISACGVCQAAPRVTTWQSWSENCTRVFVQAFPSPIPSQISVPNWAYADVTLANIFDPNIALTDTGPESSAPASSPTTATRTSTSTSPGSTTTTSLPDNNNGGSSTNVGAIAGGVVGGVVGLALIGLGVFFFLRKRKQQEEKIKNGSVSDVKSVLSGGTGMQENGTGMGMGYGGPIMGYGANVSGLSPNNTGTVSTGSPQPQTQAFPQPQPYQPYPQQLGVTEYGTQPWSPSGSQRLYDPNDPTTFPTTSSPPPPSLGTGSQYNPQYSTTSYGSSTPIVYQNVTGGSGQGVQGVIPGAPTQPPQAGVQQIQQSQPQQGHGMYTYAPEV